MNHKKGQWPRLVQDTASSSVLESTSAHQAISRSFPSLTLTTTTKTMPQGAQPPRCPIPFQSCPSEETKEVCHPWLPSEHSLLPNMSVSLSFPQGHSRMNDHFPEKSMAKVFSPPGP